MCEEEHNFNFADINLDFLNITPPRPTQGAPKATKCDTPIVADTTKKLKLPKSKSGHCTNKRKTLQSLAKRIASTDELVQETQQLQQERTQLQQQLKEFQSSANEIGELYKQEKRERQTLQRRNEALQRKCDEVQAELTDKRLACDQLQGTIEDIAKVPVKYDDVVVCFMRLTQYLEENEHQLHWHDMAIQDKLRQYCKDLNLKVPEKRGKKRAPKIVKAEVGLQCELLQSTPPAPPPPPKETRSQATQYVYLPSPPLLSRTPCERWYCAAQPPKQMRTQGTQHISTTTTRGTSTSTLIVRHSVGTSFPEPVPLPAFNELLDEMLLWDSVGPLSPICEPTREPTVTSTKSTGTCTLICNIQKPVDYMGGCFTAIKRSNSRPPSRNMFDAVKNELTTPPLTQMSSLFGTQTRQFSAAGASSTTPSNNSATSNSSSLSNLNLSTFEDLWHVFGQMIFGLLKNGHNVAPSASAQPVDAFNQQQFQLWMRLMYDDMSKRSMAADANASSGRGSTEGECATAHIALNEDCGSQHSIGISPMRFLRPSGIWSSPSGSPVRGTNKDDDSLPDAALLKDIQKIRLPVQTAEKNTSTSPLTSDTKSRPKKSRSAKARAALVDKIMNLFPAAENAQEKKTLISKLLKNKTTKKTELNSTPMNYGIADNSISFASSAATAEFDEQTMDYSEEATTSSSLEFEENAVDFLTQLEANTNIMLNVPTTMETTTNAAATTNAPPTLVSSINYQATTIASITNTTSSNESLTNESTTVLARTSEPLINMPPAPLTIQAPVALLQPPETTTLVEPKLHEFRKPHPLSVVSRKRRKPAAPTTNIFVSLFGNDDDSDCETETAVVNIKKTADVRRSNLDLVDMELSAFQRDNTLFNEQCFDNFKPLENCDILSMDLLLSDDDSDMSEDTEDEVSEEIKTDTKKQYEQQTQFEETAHEEKTKLEFVLMAEAHEKNAKNSSNGLSDIEDSMSEADDQSNDPIHDEVTMSDTEDKSNDSEDFNSSRVVSNHVTEHKSYKSKADEVAMFQMKDQRIEPKSLKNSSVVTKYVTENQSCESTDYEVSMSETKNQRKNTKNLPSLFVEPNSVTDDQNKVTRKFDVTMSDAADKSNDLIDFNSSRIEQNHVTANQIKLTNHLEVTMSDADDKSKDAIDLKSSSIVPNHITNEQNNVTKDSKVAMSDAKDKSNDSEDFKNSRITQNHVTDGHSNATKDSEVTMSKVEVNSNDSEDCNSSRVVPNHVRDGRNSEVMMSEAVHNSNDSEDLKSSRVVPNYVTDDQLHVVTKSDADVKCNDLVDFKRSRIRPNHVTDDQSKAPKHFEVTLPDANERSNDSIDLKSTSIGPNHITNDRSNVSKHFEVTLSDAEKKGNFKNSKVVPNYVTDNQSNVAEHFEVTMSDSDDESNDSIDLKSSRIGPNHITNDSSNVSKHFKVTMSDAEEKSNNSMDFKSSRIGRNHVTDVQSKAAKHFEMTLSDANEKGNDLKDLKSSCIGPNHVTDNKSNIAKHFEVTLSVTEEESNKSIDFKSSRVVPNYVTEDQSNVTIQYGVTMSDAEDKTNDSIDLKGSRIAQNHVAEDHSNNLKDNEVSMSGAVDKSNDSKEYKNSKALKTQAVNLSTTELPEVELTKVIKKHNIEHKTNTSTVVEDHEDSDLIENDLIIDETFSEEENEENKTALQRNVEAFKATINDAETTNTSISNLLDTIQLNELLSESNTKLIEELFNNSNEEMPAQTSMDYMQKFLKDMQENQNKSARSDINLLNTTLSNTTSSNTTPSNTESCKTESSKTESSKTESSKTESSKTVSLKTVSYKTESSKIESTDNILVTSAASHTTTSNITASNTPALNTLSSDFISSSNTLSNATSNERLEPKKRGRKRKSESASIPVAPTTPVVCKRSERLRAKQTIVENVLDMTLDARRPIAHIGKYTTINQRYSKHTSMEDDVPHATLSNEEPLTKRKRTTSIQTDVEASDEDDDVPLAVHMGFFVERNVTVTQRQNCTNLFALRHINTTEAPKHNATNVPNTQEPKNTQTFKLKQQQLMKQSELAFSLEKALRYDETFDAHSKQFVLTKEPQKSSLNLSTTRRSQVEKQSVSKAKLYKLSTSHTVSAQEGEFDSPASPATPPPFENNTALASPELFESLASSPTSFERKFTPTSIFLEKSKTTYCASKPDSSSVTSSQLKKLITPREAENTNTSVSHPTPLPLELSLPPSSSSLIQCASPLSPQHYDSPASPPPYAASNTKTSTAVKEIPLELHRAHYGSSDSTLMQRLLTNHRKDFHKIVLTNSQHFAVAEQQTLAELKHVIKEYLEASNSNDDAAAAILTQELLTICGDNKLIATSIAQTMQHVPRPEVELGCAMADVPPKYLGKQHGKISFVMRRLQQQQPEFTRTLLTTIEGMLFTFSSNTEKVSLESTLNLTQLYLLTISNQQLKSNPARLFIANCLYYYNLKATPMIYEVLCCFPTVLPHREERNYDRADGLITVIQHLLMCNKYDMEKSELRTKELLSKLRFEYHFEAFKPERTLVLDNLLEKIRAEKLQHVPYAFALLCKRMSQPRVEADVLQAQLLPQANEYYQLALHSNAYDARIACLLDAISMIVKPFAVETSVTTYLSVFSRFLHVADTANVAPAVDRSQLQVSAVQAILRLQRFGYANCYNELLNFKPTYELPPMTKAMLQSFIHRKPLSFWKRLKSNSSIRE